MANDTRLQRAANMMDQLPRMGDEIIHWYRNQVEVVSLSDIIPDRETALDTTVFSADMIEGFCKKGNLASPRIDAISHPIAKLFTGAYVAGVARFVLVQEAHHPEAKEFASFPPHGIEGTDEASTIPELLELPFAADFMVFYKNALAPTFAVGQVVILGGWRGGVESFAQYLDGTNPRIAIVVGNCTDLCVRELAMYLRMWANHYQQDLRVIVVENCVETYDLPFDVASDIGVMPHPGDLYHILTLYEMARNGIEVVRVAREEDLVEDGLKGE